MVTIKNLGSAYCDFLFGSSATETSKAISNALKYRHGYKYGAIEGLYRGTTQGLRNSYWHTQHNGGFFSSMFKNLKEIPKEWARDKNIQKSLWHNLPRQIFGAMKAFGKAAPALFAIYGIVTEMPNIWQATRDKGLIAGLKETTKTLTKLTIGALCGAFGSTLMPCIGGAYGYYLGQVAGDTVGGYLGGKVGETASLLAMGGSYTDKKHRLEKKLQKLEQENKIPAKTTQPVEVIRNKPLFLSA